MTRPISVSSVIGAKTGISYPDLEPGNEFKLLTIVIVVIFTCKFYAYCCRRNKVMANDKLGHF